MKKKIILIRHARPDFPGGKFLCLGRNTDIGICQEGRRSAEALGEELADAVRSAGIIYSSPLKRAQETARIIAADRAEVRTADGLTEMEVGEWDGLDFETIQERYRGLFEAREHDFSIPPPGGEEFRNASVRMRETLRTLVRSAQKDIVIAVSHSSSLRAFLCDVFGIEYRDNRTIPLDYVCTQSVFYNTADDVFEPVRSKK